MEKALVFFSQTGRVFIGNERIGNAHPLHISGQDLGSLGIDLVAQKKAIPHHSAGDLGGLAPGGSTQITNPFAGLGIKQRHRRHCAGLL